MTTDHAIAFERRIAIPSFFAVVAFIAIVVRFATEV